MNTTGQNSNRQLPTSREIPDPEHQTPGMAARTPTAQHWSLKFGGSLVCGVWCLGLLPAFAQGTAFTYQGRLNNGSSPASGSYDLTFTLFSVNSGGSSLAGPVTNSATTVSNGLFTTMVDFGPGVFTGTSNWLEIAVRTNGTGGFTILAPRQQLTPAPYALQAANANYLANFRIQPNTNGAPNLIGGAQYNFVATGIIGATIAGGGATNYSGGAWSNSVTMDFGTVGGGFGNVANGYAAVVAGGYQNINNGFAGFIGAGDNNLIPGAGSGDGAVIGGGYLNTNNGEAATVGGGTANFIDFYGSDAFIGAGNHNYIGNQESTIAGGDHNTILLNGPWSAIGGGSQQVIGDYNGFIGGGWANVIQTNGGGYSVIGGGHQNLIQGSAHHSVIGGGEYNQITGSTTYPVYAVIAGGYGNVISSNSSFATIGGGYGNLIQTNPPYIAIQFATIGGGFQNANHGTYGFIGGGVANNVFADYATICGGNNNSANWKSAVGGGAKNTANGLGAVVAGGGIWVSNSYLYDVGNTAYGTSATVGGGAANYAAGGYATIGGGYQNTAGVPQNGSGNSPVVGGGYQNTASADFSVVPGGSNNVASGPFCLAAGRRARAETTGEFVWSDSLDFDFDPFAQTGPQGVNNSFNVRSTGGFYIVTGVNGSGGITAGAYLGAGSTSWSTLSDRNAKKNFQPVNPEAVLDKLAAIPIQRWNYKWEPDDATPNLGPMAQDFKAAFYPGRDDKSISTLEFDGVELAAIQGLNEKIEGRSRKAEGRMQKLEAENAELIQRNEILEKRLEKLETMLNSQPERN